MRTRNIGDVLIRMGKVSAASVADAAAVQKARKEAGQEQPLGQVLISLKMITDADLEKALAYQEQMVSDPVGALVGIVHDVQSVVLPALAAARRS